MLVKGRVGEMYQADPRLEGLEFLLPSTLESVNWLGDATKVQNKCQNAVDYFCTNVADMACGEWSYVFNSLRGCFPRFVEATRRFVFIFITLSFLRSKPWLGPLQTRAKTRADWQKLLLAFQSQNSIRQAPNFPILRQLYLCCHF